jgi:hypothetical protein
VTVPRGAKTIAELEHAVALLRTRDAAQARAIKALRGDVDRIEAMIERADTLSPACPNSTPLLPRRIAGAAQRIARSFLNLFRSTSGKA